jgi:hypothetical protein
VTPGGGASPSSPPMTDGDGSRLIGLAVPDPVPADYQPAVKRPSSGEVREIPMQSRPKE